MLASLSIAVTVKRNKNAISVVACKGQKIYKGKEKVCQSKIQRIRQAKEICGRKDKCEYCKIYKRSRQIDGNITFMGQGARGDYPRAEGHYVNTFYTAARYSNSKQMTELVKECREHKKAKGIQAFYIQ